MKSQARKKEKREPRPFNSSYQPSKRDMEQEIDMPGADMKTLQRAFFIRSRECRKED